MRLRGLDLNLLVALDALLTERSVTLAAQRLNITQPAMSQTLSRLRDYFGDPLLRRAGAHLVLTERAESLAPAVRQALRQIEAALDPPTFDPVSSQRSFVILASDYAVTVGLAHALSRVRRLAPELTLTIAPPRPPGLAFDHGLADLVVIPRLHLAPEHPSTLLFEDDYVMVVWTGGALADGAVDIDRYFSSPHIAVRFDDGRATEVADTAGMAAPRARRIRLVAPSFNQALALVAGTDLIATAPRRLATVMAREAPLRILPLPFATPRIEECLQWDGRNPEDRGIAWLGRLIASTMAPAP